MAHYVIFDRNAGFLQWSGEYNSSRDALRGLAKVTRIDLDDEPLDILEEKFDVREVTAEQRAAVENWWEEGGKAAFPLDK